MTVEKLKMHSPDLTERNIERIAELFPTVVAETLDADRNPVRAIDFDALRQELSDHIVEGPQERYQLDWPGKRAAAFAANAPIAKTLRPLREESVDFDTTKNLFIEGDNLEVLKLLQESYLGKIKLIYIDPPYNTGNDFVYEDDFSESTAEYLARSGQTTKAGARLKTNPDSNGRFHSRWLSMMYPRLRLARNLLVEDGLLFISIDDSEVHNLRHLCGEVFGAENFVGQLVWKSRVSEDTRSKTGLSTDHEYILVFRRSEQSILRGVEKDIQKFSNPDGDVRGPWRSADLTGLATISRRPNLHYDLVDPATGTIYPAPYKGWRFEPAAMDAKIAEGRILWPSDANGRPRHKLFLEEMKSPFKSASSVLTAWSTATGTREVNDLLGGGVFDFPKPSELIRFLIEQGSAMDREDIVLDFFAGSSTTAHAVLRANALDGGMRRFIMIQLPEVVSADTPAAGEGYKTLAEVSRERIRRASMKAREDAALAGGGLDIGFRTLRLDTIGVADVSASADALGQGELVRMIDSVKPDRTDEDLLFQVLLGCGLDLGLPIRREVSERERERERAAPPTYFRVADDALIACFSEEVSADVVTEIAKLKPLRAVFRDSAFRSDADRINAEQLFRELSPGTEVKTI
ncbi:MAG: site-specific DNA-methyltransferase [Arachnia sp.]